MSRSFAWVAVAALVLALSASLDRSAWAQSPAAQSPAPIRTAQYTAEDAQRVDAQPVAWRYQYYYRPYRVYYGGPVVVRGYYPSYPRWSAYWYTYPRYGVYYGGGFYYGVGPYGYYYPYWAGPRPYYWYW
jgi:hypothetical protein